MKPEGLPKPTSVRLTATDQRLVEKLTEKLGVGLTPLVRLALRALAAKEGVEG